MQIAYSPLSIASISFRIFSIIVSLCLTVRYAAGIRQWPSWSLFRRLRLTCVVSCFISLTVNLIRDRIFVYFYHPVDAKALEFIYQFFYWNCFMLLVLSTLERYRRLIQVRSFAALVFLACLNVLGCVFVVACNVVFTPGHFDISVKVNEK